MVIRLPDDFIKFLSLLNVHQVEYLLVGGFAVGFHGYPRATQDIDIWIGMSVRNAERIVAAIREFGFDTPNLRPDLFLQENKITQMGNPPLRIDILTTIPGVQFPSLQFDGIGIPSYEVMNHPG